MESAGRQPETYELLSEFMPGIYLHHKGHLYEALHLVSDADDGRLRVLYAGLELDDAGAGPRHHIRDLEEFVFDSVHIDGSRCDHEVLKGFTTPEEVENFNTNLNQICPDDQPVVARFKYLGPYYEPWMRGLNPWNLVDH